MKKIFARATAILILLIVAFFVSRSVLLATLGKLVLEYIDVDEKLSVNDALSYVSTAISGTLGVIVLLYFRHLDHKDKIEESAPFIKLYCDNDYPAPVSDAKNNRSGRRKNTIDVDLTNAKHRYRYVYSKIKNTGNCIIEKCTIGNYELPISLDKQQEHKIRLLVPEPTLPSWLCRKRKYKISFSIEDGVASLTEGEYSLIVTFSSRKAAFKYKWSKPRGAW